MDFTLLIESLKIIIGALIGWGAAKLDSLYHKLKKEGRI